MALNKQPVPINFAQGLDTKSDPFAVAPGKFLVLENSIFDKMGRLTKRNGYGLLSELPSPAQYVSTFNNNLVALGDTIQAYVAGSKTWVNKGNYQPLSIDTLPLVRSNENQSQPDAAISSNGLVICSYIDTGTIYKYTISDVNTGQNVKAPTVITGATGPAKVFALGQHFIVVYPFSTNRLQYIAINIQNTTIVTVPTDITSQYSPTAPGNFDGEVVNNSLYLAWNATDLGGAIRFRALSSSLLLASPAVFTGAAATSINVCADITGMSPIIYALAYDLGATSGKAMAVNQSLVTVLAPTTIITAESASNITGVAQNGICSFFYEVLNNYGYDAAIPTHYVKKNTITQAGVVGISSVLDRSVGLASDAFLEDGEAYVLTVQQSDFQPAYFLIKATGDVVGKLAYQNGGGYYTKGLPSVSFVGTTAHIPYLIKDLIQAVNKNIGIPIPNGVYSQTGVNLATFNFAPIALHSAEIGGNLNLSGAFLWNYDGSSLVENGFFLYPENVEATAVGTGGGLKVQKYYYAATYEWSDNNGNMNRSAPSVPLLVDDTAVTPTPITFTSSFASGATTITVSSVAGLRVGQRITDTTTPASIQANTSITHIDPLAVTITLSLPTAGVGAPDTLKTVETLTNTVHVPTLRLTHKTANPVKIVLYRWSTDQQVFYQTTSIIAPVLNDLTIDYVTIIDTSPDLAIQGNNILYTTGGVIENISAPSFDTVALFKNRLFGIDAEDKNLLWFSKQVIENTPVEMSDLFTLFVSPTTGAQGSTGDMKCLSALDDKLIIFKKDAIYYVTGTGPDNTGAQNDFSDPVFISSTVGCENQNSIVFMPQGLMFQSDKGIWLLGRDLSTQYIGAPVEDFTKTALVQSAIGIPGTNQVKFTLDSGVTLMYDYFFGQWGTHVGIPAISSTLVDSLHTYIDVKGNVFQETPGAYVDGANPVTMKFRTSWLNLAGLQGYERAYFFYILGSYLSPHKLYWKIAYDYSPSFSQTGVITPDNFSPAWGALSNWGSDSPFGGPPTLEQWRVFFSQQRCQAFQLEIEELYDPSFGLTPGAGLTISGLNMIVGMKSGRFPIAARKSKG